MWSFENNTTLNQIRIFKDVSIKTFLNRHEGGSKGYDTKRHRISERKHDTNDHKIIIILEL